MARAAAAEWHASPPNLPHGTHHMHMHLSRPPFKLGHPPYKGPLGKGIHCLPDDSAADEHHPCLETIEEFEVLREASDPLDPESIVSLKFCRNTGDVRTNIEFDV
jgi:hypothetical protein